MITTHVSYRQPSSPLLCRPRQDTIVTYRHAAQHHNGRRQTGTRTAKADDGPVQLFFWVATLVSAGDPSSQAFTLSGYSVPLTLIVSSCDIWCVPSVLEIHTHIGCTGPHHSNPYPENAEV